MDAPRYHVGDEGIVRTDHGEQASYLRAVRRLAPVDSLLRWGPIPHLASALALGRLVTQPARFVVNEMLGRTGIRAYTLRESGDRILLRHGTADIWTFNEIFKLDFYAPPGPVADRLGPAPVTLDLGANIGLFALDALRRYPQAQILGYEPDPETAEIHRRVMSANPGRQDQWALREACAGARNGHVAFLAGHETESRVVSDPTAGSLALTMEDVLPAFASADLVKLDIEGGEWELMQDPRFSAASVVVMEYHPAGCPEEDPHAAARRLVAAHGYTLIQLFEAPTGVGMLWAYRDGDELRSQPAGAPA